MNPIKFETTVKKAKGYDLAHDENKKGAIEETKIAKLINKKVTVTIDVDEGTKIITEIKQPMEEKK